MNGVTSLLARHYANFSLNNQNEIGCTVCTVHCVHCCHVVTLAMLYICNVEAASFSHGPTSATRLISVLY